MKLLASAVQGASGLNRGPPELVKRYPDARLEALRTFTTTTVDSRGNPREADVAAFREAGFEERHIVGIILVIAVKALSNYTNHLFKPEVDEVFAGYRV